MVKRYSKGCDICMEGQSVKRLTESEWVSGFLSSMDGFYKKVAKGDQLIYDNQVELGKLFASTSYRKRESNGEVITKDSLKKFLEMLNKKEDKTVD